MGMETTCGVGFPCSLQASEISILNLSKNKLLDRDAVALTEVLINNTILQELDLSENLLGERAGLAIGAMVQVKNRPPIACLGPCNAAADRDLVGACPAKRWVARNQPLVEPAAHQRLQGLGRGTGRERQHPGTENETRPTRRPAHAPLPGDSS